MARHRTLRMKTAKHISITALAGGVGASKLLLGLYDVVDPPGLTTIVNTGDDITLHGLKISPDLDIVTYTLAGVIDPAKGWGFRGETFHALKRLAVFGRVNWFNLGDRDLATHIHRYVTSAYLIWSGVEVIRLILGRDPPNDFARLQLPRHDRRDTALLHLGCRIPLIQA